MDISESLNSAAKVKAVLEAFPRHKRLPPIEEFYPVRKLEEARREVLIKSVPFLNKVGKEIKSYIDEFGDKFFESIESRKSYIESKIQENRTERENQDRRIQLIQEIERLEKITLQSPEVIVFNEKKSMSIIEYLHEHNCENANWELKDALVSFVGLTYDKDCSKRTESYEKVMNLF